MRGARSFTSIAAAVLLVSLAPAARAADTSGPTPLPAPPAQSPVVAPTATAASSARILPMLRCSSWTFVPLTRTTCTKGVLGTALAYTAGGATYVWSAARRSWLRTAYVWNVAHRRLELDARRLVTPQPVTGRSVSVWRWTCSAWTLTEASGTTTCTQGRADHVIALFRRAGSPAAIWSPTSRRFVQSPYRWNGRGGFLALDALLLPVVGVDLGASMQPKADPGLRDFVVRCPSGSVTASIVARAGATVTFDGTPRTTSGTVTVPIAPGQAVRWTMQVPGAAPVQQQARCLPADFPAYTATRTGTPSSAWYITAPAHGAGITGPTKYVAVLDDHGTPVWWHGTSYPPIDARPLPDGGIGWSEVGSTFSVTNVLHRSDWSGNELGVLGTGLRLDAHEFLPTADGNFLALRYVARPCATDPAQCFDMSFLGGSATATIIEAEVVELDVDGTVLWTWSARDHIGFAEWRDLPAGYVNQGFLTHDDWDIQHANSVADDGDGIIVSFRNLDAVYRIRKSDGEIDWKLGGTPTPASLTVVDPGPDPVLDSQHDARRLANGHLSVYDNGSAGMKAPRALELVIDPVARTATVVGHQSDARIPFSGCCGSARRIDQGGWVTAWGGTGWVTETDAAGTPVLSVDFGNVFTYRAVPIAPGALSRATLVAGMDAMHPRTS